jgi:uncharacterized protein YwlG (UPF0340 family)
LFLREVKKLTVEELVINLWFQCCEPWRRVVVERELGRREGYEIDAEVPKREET